MGTFYVSNNIPAINAARRRLPNAFERTIKKKKKNTYIIKK